MIEMIEDNIINKLGTKVKNLVLMMANKHILVTCLLCPVVAKQSAGCKVKLTL